MKSWFRLLAAVFLAATAILMTAQSGSVGLLSTPELKELVPNAYFFRGQTATVQIRNSAGFRVTGGKLVLAALVDTSGYSQDVADKYQGLLITEVKLNVGGGELAPGQYGFGFGGDGKLLVMDVGANDLFRVDCTTDDVMMHPVPLKITEQGGAYRLYAGRKWVSLTPEL